MTIQKTIVARVSLIALVALGSLFAAPANGADKLRVSNCYIGGAILPLWLAKDAGFYAREGLDVEQIWIQGNPAVSSLVSGEIDLLYCIPHNVIGAMASGADLQFIASVYNRMQYRIVAAPGIDKMEQLKSKVVGIARIHDVSHFYLRLEMKRLGMNADTDVRVISTGGQADRTMALKNGRVAATILNLAFAMTLGKDGFKSVLDIETLNFPVVGNMSAVRRGFLKERRPVAVRFVRALVASMKKIQDDPEFSKKVLAKNLRLQDKAIIDENYRFNSEKFLEPFPTLPIEGLRYAIDSLVPTVPAAKNLKAEALIDGSILAEVAKAVP
ncbi:MAG: ABC transporter substrate-binding protein [Deltaproteobacteria bacterium]|nr:ABC transporter substrate-binding protein [Deltaproteobacteria bacterium]